MRFSLRRGRHDTRADWTEVQDHTPGRGKTPRYRLGEDQRNLGADEAVGSVGNPQDRRVEARRMGVSRRGVLESTLPKHEPKPFHYKHMHSCA